MRDFNNSTFSTPINFLKFQQVSNAHYFTPSHTPGDHATVDEQVVLHFVDVECLSVPKQFCQWVEHCIL